MSFGVQGADLFSTSVLASTTSNSTTTSLRPFANLDLTEEQRKKIREIFNTAKTQGLSDTHVQDQINAVLTPDQLSTLENDIAAAASSTSADGTKGTHGPHGPPPNGGNPFSDPNGPFANLNLTSDQQSQISQIFQDAESQGLSFDQINAKIDSILTTAQQTTFASDLENLPPPGAQGSSGASTASASVSGQSQTGDDDSTASGAAVTAASLQKQIAAAAALVIKQLQYELGVSA